MRNRVLGTRLTLAGLVTAVGAGGITGVVSASVAAPVAVAGVACLAAVSGFLAARSCATAADSGGFWRRRLLRVVPAMLLALVAGVVAVAATAPETPLRTAAWLPPLLLGSLTLAGYAALWLQHRGNRPLNPARLAVTALVAYLASAAVVWLGAGASGRDSAMLVAAALAIVASWLAGVVLEVTPAGIPRSGLVAVLATVATAGAGLGLSSLLGATAAGILTAPLLAYPAVWAATRCGSRWRGRIPDVTWELTALVWPVAVAATLLSVSPVWQAITAAIITTALALLAAWVEVRALRWTRRRRAYRSSPVGAPTVALPNPDDWPTAGSPLPANATPGRAKDRRTMSTEPTASPLSSSADTPQRFFFCHMLKTGGTSMFLRLREQYGEQAVYPNDTDGDLVADGPQMVTKQLRRRWAVRGDEIRVIIGHLPLCTPELLDAPFTTLTMLRDPVARTLSFLQFHRKLVPADAELPLEAIYDNPDRYDQLIHNHMVKMLSLTPDEMTDDMLTVVEFTPQRLTRAKAALDAIDAVGVQDQLEPFCEAVDAAYGWHVAKHFDHKGAGRPQVPASFLRRIAEDNADDMELYEHAVDLIRERGFLRR